MARFRVGLPYQQKANEKPQNARVGFRVEDVCVKKNHKKLSITVKPII